MRIHNLLECSGNFSITSGSLCGCYRYETDNNSNENNNDNYEVTNEKLTTNKYFEHKILNNRKHTN